MLDARNIKMTKYPGKKLTKNQHCNIDYIYKSVWERRHYMWVCDCKRKHYMSVRGDTIHIICGCTCDGVQLYKHTMHTFHIPLLLLKDIQRNINLMLSYLNVNYVYYILHVPCIDTWKEGHHLIHQSFQSLSTVRTKSPAKLYSMLCVQWYIIAMLYRRVHCMG